MSSQRFAPFAALLAGLPLSGCQTTGPTIAGGDGLRAVEFRQGRRRLTDGRLCPPAQALRRAQIMLRVGAKPLGVEQAVRADAAVSPDRGAAARRAKPRWAGVGF